MTATTTKSPAEVLAEMAGNALLENQALKAQLERWVQWGSGDPSLKREALLAETRALLGK